MSETKKDAQLRFSLRTLLVVTTIICVAVAAAAVLCRNGPMVFGLEIVLFAALGVFCLYKGAIREGGYALLFCLGSSLFYFLFFKLGQ